MLWTLVTASAVHIVEERGMGWQGWAGATLGPRLGVIPTWLDFWATNMALLVFGFSAGIVGWSAPAYALAFPALCIINALFFHLLPSWLERRPNPGVFTATLLYLPLGIWAYFQASSEELLSLGTFLLSFLIGGVAMAAAFGLILLGDRFGYSDV